MALFSKKSKKKNEPVADENTITAQWKVFNNRESFSLIFQDEDISERVVVEDIGEGRMVVFDPEVGIYFLFTGVDEVVEDELQDVIGYFAPDGVACISVDELKTYYCFYEGENVSKTSSSFWVGDDLCLWIPEDEDYHLLKYSENPVDNELLIPQCLEMPNETIWFKVEDAHYHFYIKGEAVAKSTNSSYNGDDLLLYDTENSCWYVFPDWENVSLYTLCSADIYDIEGDKLWSRVSDEGNYRLYDKGLFVDGEDLKASYCNDDVVVYVPAHEAHYLLIDFKNTELFVLYIPRSLPTNTHAIWMKPEAKKFKLFVEGKDMSTDVDPKIVDENLLLLHEASNTIYVCMDYNNQPFDEFQAAVIMDATDFIK